jgi:hypothetical protein
MRFSFSEVEKVISQSPEGEGCLDGPHAVCVSRINIHVPSTLILDCEALEYIAVEGEEMRGICRHCAGAVAAVTDTFTRSDSL